MKLVIRLIANGIALWLAALILPGIDIPDGQDLGESLLIVAIIALVFTVVNAVIKPVVSLLSLPITILTLGLFALVINALMLMLTGWLTSFTDYGLTVENFGWALLGGLLIAIVGGVVNSMLSSTDSRRR